MAYARLITFELWQKQAHTAYMKFIDKKNIR